MEMEALLSFLFISPSTLLALWFLKFSCCQKSRPQSHKQRLPPGPWTLPIVGSLHHMMSALPHRRITELCRRHGPVMLLRLGEVPIVVVSGPDAAALVLKTNDLAFGDRPGSATLDIVGSGGKGITFAPLGDHWRETRKLCIVELLSSTQVKRMEGIRVDEVGNLLRRIIASSSSVNVNVRKMVTELDDDVVSRAVFGGKFARQEEYIREFHKTSVLIGGFCLADLFPSSRLVRWLCHGERDMKRSYGRVQSIIAVLIEERKAAARDAGDGTGEDLLDVLIRLQEDESLASPLTAENIGAVLFEIFGGGTLTTGTVLEWAMAELVIHPEAMAKVRKVLGADCVVITNSDLGELHYMRMVIKEALRLHPPVPLLPRMTREDTEIMGYELPSGTNVYVNIFALSRDPKYWENPQEFKPERFENRMDYYGTYSEFTPFGAGRRQCPGIQFASSLIEITLANFLYHFDWILPDEANQATFDMSDKFTFPVSKRSDLQLRAIPHVGFKAIPSG